MLNTGSIETMRMEDYDTIMNLNVRSVIFLTQLCVPHIIKEKGNIVNVSSVTGTRSFPGVLGYCISKSAIDQFTKCTALGIYIIFYSELGLILNCNCFLFVSIELASKGVRVNAVNPGVIVTKLHKRAGQNDEQYANVFSYHTKINFVLHLNFILIFFIVLGALQDDACVGKTWGSDRSS